MPRQTRGGLVEVVSYLTPSEASRLRVAAKANNRSVSAEARLRIVGVLRPNTGDAEAA